MADKPSSSTKDKTKEDKDKKSAVKDALKTTSDKKDREKSSKRPDKKSSTEKAPSSATETATSSSQSKESKKPEEVKKDPTAENKIKKMEKRLSKPEKPEEKKDEEKKDKADKPSSHKTITTRKTQLRHGTVAGSSHSRRQKEKPPDDEIDKMFETLLTALPMKDEDRASMREMNTDSRWIFVNGNMDKLKEYEDKQKKQLVITPEMWAVDFKGENMTSEKAKLFMLEIVTKDNKWIDKFEKAGGITELINTLSHEAVSKHSSNIHCAEECCKILNHLKENESRMNAIDNKRCLEKLVMAGSSSSIHVKNFVYEILVVLMNIKADSHSRVVAAYDHFSYKKGEKLKYEYLMALLKNEKETTQTNILSFINTLIGVPDDFQSRCMVRNQFLALGIEQVFENLKAQEDTGANLRVQIDTFFEDFKQDNDELQDLLKTNKARTSHVDLNNTEEVFKALTANVQDNKHLQQTLNCILRDLLVLPQDQSLGLKQWLVVQSVLDQIVSQKEEISFGNKSTLDTNKLMILVEARSQMDNEREKFFMDSAKLKSELSDLKEKLESKDYENKELDAKIKEVEKKLLFTDQGSTDVTSSLNRQITELQTNITDLESKFKKAQEAETSATQKLNEVKATSEATEKQLQGKVAELNTSVESAVAKYDKLSKQVDESTKKIETLTQTNEFKDKEITALKSSTAEASSIKLITIKKELEDKFKTEAEEAAKQHKEKLLANTLRLQEEMKDKLASLASQKEAEIQALASQANSNKSGSAAVSEAQETIKKLSAQFKSETEKMQDKYDTLFSEKTKVESQIDALKLQLSSKSDLSEDAKTSLETLKSTHAEAIASLEKNLSTTKHELSNLKEDLNRVKAAKKLKKAQLIKSQQEVVSRLTVELDTIKQKSVSEEARLNQKLHDIEEAFGTSKKTYQSQIARMETETRESKDSLISKIRELTIELDQLSGQGTSKIDTQIRLIEVEKMTITRKFEQAEKELELREAELAKCKSGHEAERDQLKLDLGNLRAKLSVASQEKEDVDEALAAAKKRVKELELNSNTTNSATLLEQIDLLKTTNEDLSDQIKRLESKNNASKLIYLESQINELKDSNATFKTEMENQTAAKVSAEKKRDEFKKTIDDLNKQIEDNKKNIAKLEELESKAKKQDATIQSQTEQINSLKDAGSSSKSDSDKLAKQISDLTTKINDATEELSSAKKKLSESERQLAKSKEAETELASVKKEAIALRDQFNTASSELSATQLKMKKAEEALKESQDKIANLQKGVDAVQKEKMSGDSFANQQLNKLKTDLEAAESVKEKLQAKFDASELALSKVKEELRQLTAQLSSLQKEHDKLSDTCTKAQADAQAKTSKMESLETELKRADRDKNKIQADLDKIVEDNAKATKALEKKVETLEHKVQNLTSEVKEAQDDKKREGAKQSIEIKDLTTKVSTLSEKLDTATNSLAQVKREADSKSKRDDELKSELTAKNEDLIQQYETLEEEVENMTEELAKLMDMRLQFPKIEKKAQDTEAALQKLQNEHKQATSTRDLLQTEVGNLRRDSEKLKEVAAQLATKTTEAKDLQTNLNRMTIELEGAQTQLKIAQQAATEAKQQAATTQVADNKATGGDPVALAAATKKIQELEIKIAQLEKDGANKAPEMKSAAETGGDAPMARGGRGGPRGGAAASEDAPEIKPSIAEDDSGAMPMARGGGAPRGGRGGPRGGPVGTEGGDAAVAEGGEAADGETGVMARGGGAPRGGAARGGPRGGPAGRGGPVGEKPKVWSGPKPKVEMKGFQWQKLPPAKTGGTIFNELKAESIAVDTDMLEKLFGKEEKKEKEEVKEVSKKEEVPTAIADGKRLQNVSIFLKAIKQTPENLKMSVLTLAADILTEENTRKLIDNLPTEEEIASINAKIDELKLTKPNTTIKNLHDADQFFMTINAISMCKERCEAWLFVIAFNEKYEKMKQDLLRIKSAVAAMKDKSKYFKLLVEIVLAIGNFINAGAQGGRNGGAFGFQLIKTLSSIPGVKTNEKYSLLTYLIEFGNKQDKMINTWTSDLAECKIARSCDFSTTQAEVQDLKKECSQLAEIVSGVELCDAKWDVFLDRVPQKFKEMTTEIEAVDKMAKDVDVVFSSLLSEWGENAKMPTKDFFGPLCDFMDAYEKEVLTLKAAEEKKENEEKKKTAAREKEAATRASIDPDDKKAELAARRKKLEERKAAKSEQKEAEVKAEEIFADAVGVSNVAEDAKSGAVFTKRRLRRQTTLREKQEALEGT